MGNIKPDHKPKNTPPERAMTTLALNECILPVFNQKLGREGMTNLTIASNWADIIPAHWVGLCHLKRVIYPFDTMAGSMTITLSSMLSHEFPYHKLGILQRVNQYIGHTAISEIYLHQANKKNHTSPHILSHDEILQKFKGG